MEGTFDFCMWIIISLRIGFLWSCMLFLFVCSTRFHVIVYMRFNGKKYEKQRNILTHKNIDRKKCLQCLSNEWTCVCESSTAIVASRCFSVLGLREEQHKKSTKARFCVCRIILHRKAWKSQARLWMNKMFFHLKGFF